MNIVATAGAFKKKLCYASRLGALFLSTSMFPLYGVVGGVHPLEHPKPAWSR